MTRFLVGRAASAVAVLVFLVLIVFVLQTISPLDPVRAQLGVQASAETVAARRAELGLDQPFLMRFLDYLGGAVQGQFGDSYRTRQPVSADLGQAVPATVELVVTAMVIAVIVGLLLGTASALRWRGAGIGRLLLTFASACPPFLLGVVAIIVFYLRLGWLPAGGRIAPDAVDVPTGPTGLLTVDTLLAGDLGLWWDAVAHLILPGVVLALWPAVAIARVVEASLAQQLDADYVKTARAKGLSDGTILVRHVARNCAGAVIAMTGLQLGLLFTGVLVVEMVFGRPGLGSYVALSVPVADFPAIAGVTLTIGLVYILVNTAVDVLSGVADPRVRVA